MNSKEMLENYLIELSTCVNFGHDSEDREYLDMLNLIKKDLYQLEKVKKDLQYLQDNGAAIFRFPRNRGSRVILGFDITDCPSEIENKKEILENAMNNIKEILNCEK